jgi:NAD(P)-dependent dehydrogenase (short-subunit alcohol dehydrogenase family)
MLDRKTAVVTGASAGLGKASARQLLALGWRVIGVGRDPQRCAVAEAELAGPRFTILRADLALMDDTARLANEIAALAPSIDVLINNAGGTRATQVISSEGFEATFAQNHLSAFLLTTRLLPNLRAAGAARVIAVSSDGHTHCPALNWDDLNLGEDWASGAAYCQAKLCNVLFARELARRESANGIVSHAMHPGVVDSNFASHCEPRMQAYMHSILHRAVTPAHAAETLTFLATAELPGRSTGRYWHEQTELEPAAQALDDDAARRLWQVSEDMIAPH